MKLNEIHVETWRENKDYHIYQVIPPEGKSIILLLEGKEKRFIAAFSDIDDAREAIHGWSQKDQEGNPWKLNKN